MRISRTDTCARPVERTAQGCANGAAPPLPAASALARPASALRRAASGAAALVLALSLALPLALTPGLAFAAAGDGGDPAAAEGAADAQDATAADDAVSLAADGTAASLDGSPFSLEGFSRSQVGSNSDIGGAYAGYRYLVSDEPGSLAVIAAEGLTVVYVPVEAAQAVGFDAGSSESRSFLKRLLVALDTRNSKGGATLSAKGSGCSPAARSSCGTAWRTVSTRSSSLASSTRASSARTART